MHMNTVAPTTAILVLGLLLAGCASSAQLAQRDEERCAARGYQPKTDDYADCLVRLESDRGARMESRRRDALEKPYFPSASGQ
jgi:hypothetical protein